MFFQSRDNYITEQQMTTEKQELLDLYASSMSTTETGMMWLDRNGRILKHNKRLTDDLGYEKSELEARVLFEINPHLNLIAWRDLWKEMLANKFFEHKGEHITNSREVYPILMRGLLFNIGDEPICCAFVREAGNETRRFIKSNTKLPSLTSSPISSPDTFELSKSDIIEKFAKDNTGDLIYAFTEEGYITYINKTAVDRIGYSEKELLGKHISLINPETDPQRWQEFLAVMKKDRYLHFESEIYSKDDGAFPVEVSASYFNDGDEPFCFSFVKDLSVQKEKDARQKLYKITTDNAPTLICWVNKSADFIYANQVYLDFYGYTWDELKKTKAFEIVEGINSQKEWEEQYWAEFVKSKGDKHYIVADVKLNSGKVATTETYLFYNDEGEEEIICCLVKDITAQLAKEKELKDNLALQTKANARLQSVNLVLRDDADWKPDKHQIITQSKKYQKILKQLDRVAATSATVLITGETGTGKELLAKSVHFNSPRKDNVLVNVNCATISEGLFESQLFGHEKGAFTGAHVSRQGRFEVADGGTIFLDEIGEMPLHLQAKLLRVLQEGEFERVGSTTTRKTDVRVVAATNRDLERMVNEGKFREDLYFRLNVFPLHNLPLRDRKEDIPLLIQHFLRKYSKRINREITEVSAEGLEKMQAYNFPGNVRELENMVERAMILSDGKVLRLDRVMV